MKKPNRGTLLKEGRAARERAMRRAGSARISNPAWYPEIQAFMDRGWGHEWISEATLLSDRQIRRILQFGRSRVVRSLEMPVEAKLLPVFEAMRQLTPEAFEAFFICFSGLDYLPAHAKEWVRLFIEHRDLMLNVPPGHAKTTIMAIWLVVWLLIMDRNNQIMVVSKTGDAAKDICRSIADILSYPEITAAFGRYVPSAVDDEPWKPEQGRLMVLGRTKKGKPGDLSVLARGMDQQILSFRPTVVICDDITDEEIALSPAEHVKEMRKFRGDILTRVEDATATSVSGRALVIGQRVSEGDIYGELQEVTWTHGPMAGEPLWHVIEMQALPGGWESGEALWPQKWTIEELSRKHAELGDDLFETRYQQRPVAGSAARFRDEWINACKKDRPGNLHVAGKQWIRAASLDPSPTEFNAGIVADVSYDGAEWRCEIVAVDEWRGGVRDTQSKIEGWIANHRITHLVIEDSAVSKLLLDSDWFHELEGRLTLVKHKTQYNKNDAVHGVEAMAVDFEYKRIGLPWGDAEGQRMSGILIKQLRAWGRSRVFDAVMALWFLKFNRKKFRRKSMGTGTIPRGGARPRLNAAGRSMAAAEERSHDKRRLGETRVLELTGV